MCVLSNCSTTELHFLCFLFFFKKTCIYLFYVYCCLPACLFVCQLYAWCLRGSEENLEFPGAGVQRAVNSHKRAQQEQQLGYLQPYYLGMALEDFVCLSVCLFVLAMAHSVAQAVLKLHSLFLHLPYLGTKVMSHCILQLKRKES